MGWGSPKNLVKTHGNANLRKGLRKPKGSTQAWDVQEKTSETQELVNDVTKEPMALLGH